MSSSRNVQPEHSENAPSTVHCPLPTSSPPTAHCPPSPFSPLSWLSDELAALDRAGLRRRLSSRAGGQVATIVVEGQTLVNFGSNDYLALAADPRLAAAAIAAIESAGLGSGASPL